MAPNSKHGDIVDAPAAKIVVRVVNPEDKHTKYRQEQSETDIKREQDVTEHLRDLGYVELPLFVVNRVLIV